MEYEEKWNELKEHIKKQKARYEEQNSPLNKLGVHIQQDCLNKMYQLEHKK